MGVGPGSVVASRFRLDDLLEEHSGARLWRATDLTLARNVAIHVLDDSDPRAGAVLTAARTSATVSDGHILRVLDALQEDGVVHVVHEWGTGVSLDRLLAEATFDPRRSAWVVREVADAIAVAHRHGIAHGRLLPENVLVSDAGSIKLLGFVVDAVLYGRARKDEVGPLSEHESDVVNLGALLYACLTGRWAGSPASVLPAAPRVHGRVCRPRQVRPGIQRDIDGLCDQILNPDPRTGHRRYESAAEIGQALSGYLGDPLATANLPVSGSTVLFEAQMAGVPGTEAPPAFSDATITEMTAAGFDDAVAPAPRTGPAAGGGLEDRLPGQPPPAGASAQRPGSMSIRLAALLGLLVLLLLALVVGISLGRPSPSGQQSPGSAGGAPSSSQGQVVQPVAVRDFDPDGGPNPEENPDLVPYAVDGKPSTAWETKTYFDGPVLAPYRSGVGLLLDLGRDVEVREVTVSLEGSPYDLKLLASPPGATSAPTSTAGLTTVVSRSGVSGQVRLRAGSAVRTRYLVVWLTALPAADGGYRGAVSEVVVRS